MRLKDVKISAKSLEVGESLTLGKEAGEALCTSQLVRSP